LACLALPGGTSETVATFTNAIVASPERENTVAYFLYWKEAQRSSLACL
jgi:hypothetical protein